MSGPEGSSITFCYRRFEGCGIELVEGFTFSYMHLPPSGASATFFTSNKTYKLWKNTHFFNEPLQQNKENKTK